MKFARTFFAWFCFACPLSASPADQAALLAGVREIGTDGVPGGVCVFGPDAFALVAGTGGKTARLPVVGAARLEKGRVVAFGHNRFLSSVSNHDTGNLLVNSARWTAGEGKIGIVGNPLLLARLEAAGLAVVSLDEKDWASKLAGFGAICIDAHKLAASDVAPLESFIRSGGGLVTAATGWGWLYGGKDRTLLATAFPGNLLLKNAGLVFTAATPDKPFTPAGDSPLLNASAALLSLNADRGKNSQAEAILADAIRALPPGDTALLPKIDALQITPATERILLTRGLEKSRLASPGEIRAHPSAGNFPGSVPKDAPRVTDRALSIDTGVPRWHGTGLYAAPGEVIRVSLPPEAVTRGLSVRIGCHTDALWHHEIWRRAPEISRRFPLVSAETSAANAFGGLIYIEVPGNAVPGALEVRISGAVEAPRFVLGKTAVADWLAGIRHFPAPWAEMETGKIILSVPSEKIRDLANPGELMALWDRIMDAEADLSTIPRDRKFPERIVADVQISAGYMHSGYPIMTLLDDSVEHSLSTARLAAGSWGHFHELGHNHQQGDWTFDGTTEVTCNLYSLYVMETVCGKAPGLGHESMDPVQVEARLRNHIGSGAPFEKWKADPFLALTMYHQLRVGFGWQTYQKVFTEYRALPEAERPENDVEKRDQWLVRFSRAAGRNLGPFFQAWGVPTGEDARRSVADLPGWMPADWPGRS